MIIDEAEFLGINGENDQDNDSSMTVLMCELLRALLVMGFIIAVSVTVKFTVCQVDGVSMNPTLYNDETVFATRPISDLQRGDVVTFINPCNSKERFIKRVIGLPGEKVEIINSKVYINKKELKEPYILEKMYGEDVHVIVPAGKVFVMGDNRNNSADSRYFIGCPSIVKDDLLRVYKGTYRYK